MYGPRFYHPDNDRYGLVKAAAAISAARTSPPKTLRPPSEINTPILEKKIPLDDDDQNNILVTDPINVLSPSNSPLDGKILFPETVTKSPPSVTILEHRTDKLENLADLLGQKIEDNKRTTDDRLTALEQQVDLLNQKFDTLLALLTSQKPSAPVVSPSAVPQIQWQIVQDSASASPADPSEILPVSENSPVLPPTSVIPTTLPGVWNGTNSKVKAVVSRSSPVAPTSNSQAKAPAKPTTVPPIKASDPPPRPKVSPAHTSATPRVSPRRTTTSPQLVHHISRVAEGEPDRRPRRLSNSSSN
jgi:hypothetical protein